MFLKKFKKFLALTLLIFILFSFNTVLADDLDSDEDTTSAINEVLATSNDDISSLNINARSAIILDRKSKKIIYGKNETSKVKMASTTKIMTATVIIENCDLNQTVEVSKKAAGMMLP